MTRLIARQTSSSCTAKTLQDDATYIIYVTSGPSEGLIYFKRLNNINFTKYSINCKAVGLDGSTLCRCFIVSISSSFCMISFLNR